MGQAIRQSDILNGSAADCLRAANQLRKDSAPDAAAVVLRALLKRFPANKKAQAALSEIEKSPPLLPRGRTAQEATTVQALLRATQQNRHADMMTLGQELLPAYPDCALLLNILGVAHAAEDRHREAIAHYRRAIMLRPDYAEAVFNLGSSHHSLAQHKQALGAYGLALKLDPTRAAACNNIGSILQDEGDFEGAAEAFSRAIDINPRDATFFNNRGVARKATGRLDDALSDFEAALAIKPDFMQVYHHSANALKSMGRVAEAKTCLHQALRVRPDDAVALEALARNTKPSEAADLLPMAQRLTEAAAPGSSDLMRAHYASAELRLALGHNAEAMEHLAEAGQLGKANVGFNIKEEEDIFRGATSPFAPGPAALEEVEPLPFTPIFILGMPRSGTSLVEEIVSSHSAVHGAGELECLRRALMRTNALNCEITPDVLLGIREFYVEEATRILGSQPTFFTDKMPINFRFVGHIARALPEAKIIHTNRAAAAVGWSNYRIHFPARGMAFTFEQRDVARMIRLHDTYMAHWHQCCPGRVIELDYEALTEDPGLHARRLFEALELPWEEDVLSFHNKERAVRTASAAQVRKGIYRGSSEAWRDFEPWLAPMFEELESYLPPELPTLPAEATPRA